MFERTGKPDPVIGTVWRWGLSDSLFCIVKGMDQDGDYLAQFFTGVMTPTAPMSTTRFFSRITPSSPGIGEGMFSNKKGPYPLVGTVWDDPGWGKFIVKAGPDFDDVLLVTYVSGSLKGEQEYVDIYGLFDRFQFIRGSWRKHVQKK